MRLLNALREVAYRRRAAQAAWPRLGLRDPARVVAWVCLVGRGLA